MTIRCTSIAAYRELKANGKLKTQRGMILRVIADRANMSLREIQKAVVKRFDKFLDVGTISARVKAMKDEKILVEEPYPRKCIYSKVTVHPVHIADSQIVD